MLKHASKRHIHASPFPGATWMVIGLLGTTLGMLCSALTVLTGPGPALVIVPVGLLVLAAQLLWAKNFLQTVRQSRGTWSTRSSHGA
ncbi:MAG: hypothetical protein H7274_14640 [Rhodoferax sp.]|nr:hypothetical protein [Rhodoferax sp.]